MAVSRTGKLDRKLIIKQKNGFTIGPNGQKIPNWEVVSKPWFAYKQQYINQIQNAIGTILDNTVTVIIRQRQKVTPQLDFKVFIKKSNSTELQEYDIVKMNPDVENDDFLVMWLRAVE